MRKEDKDKEAKTGYDAGRDGGDYVGRFFGIGTGKTYWKNYDAGFQDRIKYGKRRGPGFFSQSETQKRERGVSSGGERPNRESLGRKLGHSLRSSAADGGADGGGGAFVVGVIVVAILIAITGYKWIEGRAYSGEPKSVKSGIEGSSVTPAPYVFPKVEAIVGEIELTNAIERELSASSPLAEKLQIVDLAISRGANINGAGRESSYSYPAAVPIQNNDVELLKALVSRGLRLDLGCPMHYAAWGALRWSDTRMLTFLRDQKAKIDCLDSPPAHAFLADYYMKDKNYNFVQAERVAATLAKDFNVDLDAADADGKSLRMILMKGKAMYGAERVDGLIRAIDNLRQR